MTGALALPLTGYAGWRFLSRTLDTQRAIVAESPQVQREVDAFRDRIATVRTAEALVADRELLRVALGAFGLEADLTARAFVRQVLDSAPGDRGALANRLADSRYRDFARAFGFAAPGGPATTAPGFADRIAQAYLDRQLEVAVGSRDGNLRLALAADRELARLSKSGLSAEGAWFAVMGQRPLRAVFETALGLPAAFAGLDLDRQRETLSDRAGRAVGAATVDRFADPARREDLIRLFLLRAEAAAGPSGSTPGAAALTLLRRV